MVPSALRVALMAGVLASTGSGCSYDWTREQDVDAARTDLEGSGGLVSDARVEPDMDAIADAARDSTVGAAGDATVPTAVSEDKDAGPAPVAARPVTDAALCEGPLVTLTPTLPEVMIVLDRSTSMQEGARWEPVVRAIKSATAETEAQAAFGLLYFPPDSSEQCGANAPKVLPAPKTARIIAQSLDMTFPKGLSPLGAALDASADFFIKQAAAHPDAPAPVVALITDGLPSCGSSTDVTDRQAQQAGAKAAVARLRATSVVFHAFGYQLGLDPEGESFVKSLAEQGSAMHYHGVSSSAELTAMLREVILANTPCTFLVPDNVSHLASVELAGKPIARANYEFSVGQLTLKGVTCDMYRAAVVPLSVRPICEK